MRAFVFILGFVAVALAAEVEIIEVNEDGTPVEEERVVEDTPPEDEEHVDEGRFEMLKPKDDDPDAFPSPSADEPMAERPKRYSEIRTKAEEYESLLEKKRQQIKERLAKHEAELKKMDEENDRAFEETYGPRAGSEKEKKVYKGKVVRIRPKTFTEAAHHVMTALMTVDKFKSGTEEMWNKTTEWLSDISFYNPADNTTIVLDLSPTEAVWNTTKSWLSWGWDVVSGETFQDVVKRMKKTWEINNEKARLDRLNEKLGNAYKEARAEGMEERKEKYIRGETRHYMSKHEKAERKAHEEELRLMEEMLASGVDPIMHERGAKARRRFRAGVKDKHDEELIEHDKERRRNHRRAQRGRRGATTKKDKAAP